MLSNKDRRELNDFIDMSKNFPEQGDWGFLGYILALQFHNIIDDFTKNELLWFIENGTKIPDGWRV